MNSTARELILAFRTRGDGSLRVQERGQTRRGYKSCWTGTAHIRPSSRLVPQPCPALGSLYPLEPVPLASPRLPVTRHPIVGRVHPGLLFSGTLSPRWCWGRRLTLLGLSLWGPFFTRHPQPGPGQARDSRQVESLPSEL